jgi:predicted enzyme related to lactoylglutathione lyase
MPRPIHFEIHAEDPERAMAFYTDLFGWTFEYYMADYWSVVTGEEGTPGINGGLVRRRGGAPIEGQPVSAFVCTLDVPSVDEFLEKVTAAGGKVTAPKMPIPGMAWLAYCLDTEGNQFGMFEADPTAQ